MKLHAGWRTIVRRHWSVRWITASAFLSAVSPGLESAAPYLPSWINPLYAVIASSACAAMALVCKIIAQENVDDAGN